jgi:WD40 repeat protein
MLQKTVFCSLAILLAVTGATPQGPAQPRHDAECDPLPEGAVARLGTLRFKHYPAPDNQVFFRGQFDSNSRISSAAFSPDGKRIATVGQAGQNLIVWDSAAGKEIAGPWSSVEDRFFAQAIAFSPDGAFLAGSGLRLEEKGVRSNGVFLWDIAAAKTVSTISPPTGAPSGLAFRDGGKTLLTVEVQQRGRNSTTATVRWWDVATGKQLQAWSPPSPTKTEEPKAADKLESIYESECVLGSHVLAVRMMKYDGENQRGYTLSEGSLTLYDLSTDKEPGRVIHQVKHKTEIDAETVAYSADGKRMAFFTARGQVEVRDCASGKLVNAPPIQTALARTYLADMCLSPDGKLLALSTGASKIALCNQDDPAAIRTFNIPPSESTGKCLGFSPDGKMLLICVGPDVRQYNLATLKEVRSWVGHRDAVNSVAFSADGRAVRTSTGTSRNQAAADLLTWDTANWKPLHGSLASETIKPNVGLLSPDRTIYIGKGPKERLNVYEAATDKLVGRLSAPAQSNAAPLGFFSPNSKFYVLPSKDGGGKDVQMLYAMPSCKLLCQLPASGLAGNEKFAQPQMFVPDADRQVVFSADGKVVALFAREDGRIAVIETATGTVKHRLGTAAAPEEKVNFRRQAQGGHLELSSDGKFLASWSALDNRVRIWELTSGKERRFSPRGDVTVVPVRFAWSPDGRTLALAKRQTIQLWEVSSLRVRKEFTGHAGEIRALAFSPDGRLLATGGVDTTVLIWETRGL